MLSIAKGKFTAPLVREYSATSTADQLGSHDCTLELFEDGSTDYASVYAVEWDIPTLNETVQIGIWCDKGTKIVNDYDGVFEVPKEIIKFLEDNGFDCSYCKDI